MYKRIYKVLFIWWNFILHTSHVIVNIYIYIFFVTLLRKDKYNISWGNAESIILEWKIIIPDYIIYLIFNKFLWLGKKERNKIESERKKRKDCGRSCAKIKEMGPIRCVE